jgi:cold shock CspA family protein
MRPEISWVDGIHRYAYVIGFIEPVEGDKEVFVHASALEAAGIRALDEEDRVSLELEDHRRGRGKQAAKRKSIIALLAGQFAFTHKARCCGRATDARVFDKENYVSLMFTFDYTASAELFATQGRSGLRYRRFAQAAEAIRYAIEKLPPKVLSGTSLEVNDERYDATQIRALYDSQHYPLTRASLNAKAQLDR